MKRTLLVIILQSSKEIKPRKKIDGSSFLLQFSFNSLYRKYQTLPLKTLVQIQPEIFLAILSQRKSRQTS